jgi:hypothetical protein
VHDGGGGIPLIVMVVASGGELLLHNQMTGEVRCWSIRGEQHVGRCSL